MSQIPKKQVHLTLQKIHNWPSPLSMGSPTTLHFSFYSKQSQHLITQKQISRTAQHNQLQLMLSLKISYPPQQNIVVIAIKQVAQNGNADAIDFGELQIDLDQLGLQKCKYVAFGNFEKILQVGVAEAVLDGPREISLEEKRVRNKQFIEQRNNFLQQYKQKNEQLRQQFEQKISRILKDQKSRKHYFQKRPFEAILSPQQKFSYEQSDHIQTFQSEINKKQLQQLLVTRSAYHEKKGSTIITHIQDYAQGQGQGEINLGVVPRKHKLILGTLNIVEKDDRKQTK